jgi:hypothetical protein
LALRFRSRYVRAGGSNQNPRSEKKFRSIKKVNGRRRSAEVLWEGAFAPFSQSSSNGWEVLVTLQPMVRFHANAAL